MTICIFSRNLLLVGNLFVAILLVVHGPVSAQTGGLETAAALVVKLKSGSYNLYVRHAATDWSQGDKINAHGEWASCDPAEVRQLSDKGRDEARRLGAALKALAIPIGQAFASPYCRTMETARLMSGLKVEATTDLMNLRSARFVGGREAVVARARKRLSQRTPVGVNILFVAHGNLGRAATDQSLAEGEVLILNPRGDGRFEITGGLKLEDLEAMSN